MNFDWSMTTTNTIKRNFRNDRNPKSFRNSTFKDRKAYPRRIILEDPKLTYEKFPHPPQKNKPK